MKLDIAGDRFGAETRHVMSRFPLGGTKAGARPATSPAGPNIEVVLRAEALGIPWERLLLDEIQAEEALRRHVVDVGAEMPLEVTVSLLPFSFLKSWRVRDQIQNLSCEARGASFRGAVRELRSVFRRLIGQPDRSQPVFTGHLWVAYQRVLLLQRASRAARRSRGSEPERLAAICSDTHCSFEDAAWALSLQQSAAPGHRLDAAVARVRGEGFDIPRASTEARAFAKLRRIVHASPRPAPHRRSRTRAQDRASLPPRVAIPLDLI